MRGIFEGVVTEVQTWPDKTTGEKKVRVTISVGGKDFVEVRNADGLRTDQHVFVVGSISRLQNGGLMLSDDARLLPRTADLTSLKILDTYLKASASAASATGAAAPTAAQRS